MWAAAIPAGITAATALEGLGVYPFGRPLLAAAGRKGCRGLSKGSGAAETQHVAAHRGGRTDALLRAARRRPGAARGVAICAALLLSGCIRVCKLGRYKYADRSRDRSGTHPRDPRRRRRVLIRLCIWNSPGWAVRGKGLNSAKGCPAPAFTEGRCRPRNSTTRWRRSSRRARTAAA